MYVIPSEQKIGVDDVEAKHGLVFIPSMAYLAGNGKSAGADVSRCVYLAEPGLNSASDVYAVKSVNLRVCRAR